MPKGQQSIERRTEKDKHIASILRNETYAEDSAIYRRLASMLHRLTLHDLRNLDIVVGVKCREAVDAGAAAKNGKGKRSP